MSAKDQAAALGSSPHVRGTRACHMLEHEPAGIIPACAGNTRVPDVVQVEDGDHPRMCGEHMPALSSALAKPGSSPHVRGTPLAESAGLEVGGIIPACAGNTQAGDDRLQGGEDHPRMCGEHLRAHCSWLLPKGSSPHVRGTLFPDVGNILVMGIIPACAGNTDCRSRSTCYIRDHPRMCGEHQAGFTIGQNRLGSSPHVRGTLISRWATTPYTRIIPACAGNTLRCLP